MSTHASYRFETPENVQVRYEPAGLGTRFLAWFIDQILVWMITMVLLVALLIAGMSVAGLFDTIEGGNDPARILMYFAGFMALVWGLGSFAYFTLSELLLRGQTIGKRVSSIRVVKADGFQLDAASIVMRNVFRVVDQLPPMWIIPFVSQRSQRAGDMVAGTLVISEAPQELSVVREALAQRAAADAVFRFNQAMLRRVRPTDFAAIERMLDRWPELPVLQREQLLDAYTSQLARKLQIEPPAASDRLRFLEDLFLAELRRRDRALV